jgi:hypothetical protein
LTRLAIKGPWDRFRRDLGFCYRAALCIWRSQEAWLTKRKREGLEDLNVIEADSVRSWRAWIRTQILTQSDYHLTSKNTTFIKFIIKEDGVLKDWGEGSKQDARMFALQPDSDQCSKRHENDDIITGKTKLVR